MFLHVQFESGERRDIPVDAASTLTVTHPVLDVISLGGLKAMFLTSDSHESLIDLDLSAEAVARAVGFVSPVEAQALRDEIAMSQTRFEQQERTVQTLQDELARLQTGYVQTVQGGGTELLREQATEAVAVFAKSELELETVGGPHAVWADEEDDGA